MTDVLFMNEDNSLESGSSLADKNVSEFKALRKSIQNGLDIFGKNRKARKAIQYDAAESILDSLNSRWDLSDEFIMPGRGPASIVTKGLNLVFKKLNGFITDLTRHTVGLASVAPGMHLISGKVLSSAETLGKKGEEIEASCRDLSEGMRISSESAGAALEKSGHIVGEISRARNLTSSSFDRMKAIDKDMAGLSSAIFNLEESSKNIGLIIDSISDISETTGLLSLNAFIEAGRAGKYGAGFGVIAQEIRQLSGKSGQAASEIKKTLMNISELIDTTAVSVRHVKECVASGLEVSKDADSALCGVGIEHSGFHGQLESVLKSVNDQEKAVSAMLSGIAEIADAGRSGARESRKLSDSADRIRTLAEKQLESAGSFILPQYKKVEAVVTEIASDPDIVSMTDNVNRKIYERMQLFPYLELVYLTDGKGIQISANIFRDREKAESGLSAVGKNWSTREWFRKVKETNKAYISNVYRSAATDSYCMTVSVPVFRNGFLVGVLGADVNFENLLDI